MGGEGTVLSAAEARHLLRRTGFGELQELFTLGVTDENGNANYTQADVEQIARAFTGWDYDRSAFLDTNRHDYMANYPGRGPKVIYQSTGGFGSGGRSFTVNGEGE